MRIVIVGAGFSGIAAAKALQDRGHHDYVILEKGDGVGGVWRENHYPGAACDVPSYLYSFSFAQRRDWSQPCSPQSEIETYLHEVARDYGLLEHCRFGEEVTTADWDETARRWTVGLASGEQLECDLLLLGCGQLSRPSWPAIEGIDDFAGHAFHSAEWDHDHDLTGKRVAVIGTGASAIQFVPPVAEQAGELTVFQRTAPYMLPRRNPRYARSVRWAIAHVPGLQTLRRAFMWGVMESFIFGLTKSRVVYHALRLWSATFMRRQIKDPVLRERLAPDYEFGCKRILFSSYYLPALQRPNVEVVSDRIERITPTGVVTAGGQEHAVDTIIYGTGFRAGEFVTPIAVHGTGGQELQEAWRDAPIAHHGVAVHGFPNLFLLYGPNTNLGVGSIVVMIEAQAGYIAQAADLLRDQQGTVIDVRADAQAASDAQVQAGFDGTVWTQCVSWYRKDGTGRVVGNWPRYMRSYVQTVRDFDHEHYTVDVPSPAPAVVA
jgi:cation diffusion facilitator CzcD-associated flavoprotein CzcO